MQSFALTRGGRGGNVDFTTNNVAIRFGTLIPNFVNFYACYFGIGRSEALRFLFIFGSLFWTRFILKICHLEAIFLGQIFGIYSSDFCCCCRCCLCFNVSLQLLNDDSNFTSIKFDFRREISKNKGGYLKSFVAVTVVVVEDSNPC